MEKERLPHDPAYKQFFNNPEMVESLLRDFVPEDFVRELDFSSLEQCSGSYVTDDLRERHDDIVWRLRWNGEFIYLYLLIEFQSSSDPWMAVRILAYTALLWQDLIKSGAMRGRGIAARVPDGYLQWKKSVDSRAGRGGAADAGKRPAGTLSAPAALFSSGRKCTHRLKIKKSLVRRRGCVERHNPFFCVLCASARFSAR